MFVPATPKLVAVEAVPYVVVKAMGVPLVVMVGTGASETSKLPAT
jgi:hypothetical protein